MRARKLTFAALAIAAGLSLTACNDEDVTGAGSSGGTGKNETPAASAGSSSGGGSSSDGVEQGAGKDSGKDGGKDGGDGGKDSAAGAGSCRTDALDISAVDGTVGGDDEGTVAVTFKNGGGRDCALNGYAGVDLKTSAGTVSAERSGGKATPMTLKDGESVTFGVTYPLNESGGSGVKVTAIVVTPPGETKSFSLAWPGAATLPVTDGSGTPVKVGPMGSAGQGGAS
ncbi:DUF4232 domain-containing protein [Streptomyces sp. NPDC020412]|uniref:DUF4232 domain-containing protein n=1 Tax=Streptomyces sp. NPDC020412 TaxID=3365073 RepID=UPI00379AC1FA